MSPVPNSDPAITALAQLFTSYSSAYGTFEITGADSVSGKRKGRARTVPGTPSLAEWSQHLSGHAKGLGLIPLLDDGVSVKWAAIDIDDNQIDHCCLEAKVNELGLPLIVCRSKSGGAHCYLFLEEPCSAKETVDALANWAAALGHPGVEIFPKQTRRDVEPNSGNPRPGNWINLPYFGGEATERYCVYRGKPLSLGEFIELAESNRAGAESLKIRHITAPHSKQTRSSKAREGRNGFLYAKGCVLRAQGAEEPKIRDELLVLNRTATSSDQENFSAGPLEEAEVDQIVASVLRHEPGFHWRDDNEPYCTYENQLFRRERTSRGERITTLSNFAAEIVEDICRDDGASMVREYRVKGTLANGMPLSEVVVPAGKFGNMHWVPDAWGAKASIKVGMTNAQHTAAAIQSLSEPAQRRIYTHTGWRKINGKWHFLHGEGAIAASGFVPDVEVELERGLRDYQLPDPKNGDTKEAIRASIELLGVAPDHVIWPLLAAVFRSVLAQWLPAELSVFVVGPTGTFKTCLAAVCTAYFGKGWTVNNTPASWSSTANALERMAFTAKDHLLLIDDFAPNGTYTDVRKLHATVERVFRAQGNQSGRFRMRADSTLAGSLPPRGLILATGEDMPKGQSLQARLVLVQIAPGDVNVARLTSAQAYAESGAYAFVMAAFTQRLARLADGGKLSSRLDARRKELRAEAISGAHTRMPDNIASLMVGAEEFLDFAVEVGAVTDSEMANLRAQAWAALNEQANAQVNLVVGTDPASRFLSLIAATVSSKRANIAGINGLEPLHADALGWDCRGSAGREYMVANGPVIGWIDKDDLYLEAETAMACAKGLAREQGNELPFSDRRIQKSLQEAGLLKSSEPERNTLRKTLHGRRRYVLHMSAETALGIDPRSNAVPPKLVRQIDEDTPF
jgi:hypothetical protein